jgi:predicted phosphodiesterase
LIYAVISDIHSNLDALEAVIGEIPKAMPTLCLGDIVGYGAQPNEVVDAIRGLKPLEVLMGNHDYAVVTGNVQGFSAYAATAIAWTRKHLSAVNLQFLSNLRSQAHLELENIPVALYHGSPRDSLFEYVYPETSYQEVNSLMDTSQGKIVFLGHTHVPMRFSTKNRLLANPGSVGQPRDGNPKASIGFLKVCAGNFDFEHKRVEYDVESAAAKITQSGLPNFLASRLYKGV